MFGDLTERQPALGTITNNQVGVIGYQIISSSDALKVSKNVNKAISHGWQPKGDLIVSDGCFIQCVIKIGVKRG